MSIRSVCIVTQQYKAIYSGIGLHSRNLVKGLQAQGHCITLLTQQSQSDDVDLDRVEMIAVPDAPFKNSQARWLGLSWSFARKLNQLNAAERFDIIHFTDARESLLYTPKHRAIVGNVNDYYAAQLQPLVFYRANYSDAWQRWLYYAFVHQCEQIAFRRLGALIANSHYTLAAIESAYRVERKKLFRCNKCIDLSLFAETPRADFSGKMVLFAGGNMQRKGLRTLIQAAPHILQREPATRFVVVGDDANTGAMQSLCREVNVAAHFEFIGWMPNEVLRDYYRRASVFAMPSLVEAFGMVLVEAMASGTPVVATRVGGIPELVRHQENGLLIEPNQPAELADAVIAILSDANLARRFGENGRATAQRFGIDQMLECTMRVYEKLLGGPF